MSNNIQKLIKERQVPTLKQSLLNALDYHYSNFVKLEEIGEPFSIKDMMGVVDSAQRMKANENIKFELQAYINQLKRLKHFINFLKKKGFIKKPKDAELIKVWLDIMEKEGVVNLLANKWASHRSVDYPHKEDDDSLHLSILLNLEQVINMWDNGHLSVTIKNHELILFRYHPKVINFVKWIFEEVEKS